MNILTNITIDEALNKISINNFSISNGFSIEDLTVNEIFNSFQIGTGNSLQSNFTVNNLIVEEGVNDANINIIDQSVIVTTDSFVNVNNDFMELQGSIEKSSFVTIIERGLVWNTIGNPLLPTPKVIFEGEDNPYTCEFNTYITSTIYARAYAITSIGTFYGDILSAQSTLPP